jgi:phosphoribosylaminoimidazole carboxylase (NCAIR synthetase)
VNRQAQDLAIQAVRELKGIGVFGVEMFLLDDGRVLINEIAPRPHNSGHYTIEACPVSQFEQHLRAITDLPLAGATMSVPAAVTINILGERTGPALLGRRTFEMESGAIAHIYGKSQTAFDRKMGHITLTGEDATFLVEKARRLRATIEV